MTTNNADIRLELFDGVQWFPMEFPRDEAPSYEVVSSVGRKYVERGAAQSVRVQLRRNGDWTTVKTFAAKVVETLGSVTLFCTCGHAERSHDSAGADGCRITLSSRVCPCERFELREGELLDFVSQARRLGHMSPVGDHHDGFRVECEHAECGD